MDKGRVVAVMVCLSALQLMVASKSVAAPEVQKAGSIMVTATQLEQAVEDVQASVEVIEREQIEQFGGNNPTEILKYAAGIDAHSSGSSSRVHIRGFDTKQVLLLVDGQRRTTKYGSANINLTALEDIERIEIVRGPMSSLYGSDALGGVVNIITREPGSDPATRLRMTLGTDRSGQRDTINMGASHETGSTNRGHLASVEMRMRQPYRHDESSVATDYNRLRHTFFNYRGQTAVGEESRLRWDLELVDQNDQGTRVARNGTAYESVEEERRVFVGGKFTSWLGGGELASRLSISHSDGESKRDVATTESTKYSRAQFDGVYLLPVGVAHLLSLGGGWQHDNLDVSTFGERAKRDNFFGLLQDQWEISRDWHLVGGLRYDHYSDFGNTVNPRVTLAWTPGPWQLRAGYGSAYRAPAGTEQYISIVRGTFLIRGNPDLEPEKSRTMEGAVRYSGERGHGEVVVHRSVVRGLINSVRTGQTERALGVVTYGNVDRALLEGVEISGRLMLTKHLSVWGGLDILRAEDDNSGERLTNRAGRTWRLGIQYDAASWSLQFRGRIVEDYYNSDPGVPLPPSYSSDYRTFDLRADYRWNEHLTLFAGIDNIFDKLEPDNFVITSTNQTDPDRRYGYLGMRAKF